MTPTTSPSPFSFLDADERERALESIGALEERARVDPGFTDEDRAFIAAQFAMAKGGALRREAVVRIAQLIAGSVPTAP